MNKIEVVLKDFKNAPENALLIKRNGEWTPITLKELLQETNEKISKLERLPNDFKILVENNKHFHDICKSHFMVVFNAFLIQILLGEIVLTENENELLKLDEKVIYDEIKIEDAIKLHPFLEKMYKKLYFDKKEYKFFPEV